ncbi:MAG: glycoside hydrolase family 78 protein [Oscillospiraceae bacterium]|jgi:alpha-L-rhamnosidase|nr:glycoside hydrolase family 78 protein [Oscillospiraceae bacterium]
MESIFTAQWIKFPLDLDEGAAAFLLDFTLEKPVQKATLQATALGIYTAEINARQVGGEVLAPGWTNYRKRLQYQTYDVTDLLAQGKNNISIEVGRGWRMHAREKDWLQPDLPGKSTALIATLSVDFADGTSTTFRTGGDWLCKESKTRGSNIYNGEIYDAGFEDRFLRPAQVIDYPHEILMPLQGERIVETERLPVQKIFTTPEGELVLDFGQVLTGYVAFRIKSKKGSTAILRHAETLDTAGNFYTANLRTAKQEIVFIGDGEAHSFKPRFSFQGFRYIQPKNWPCEVKAEDFEAIVVHSEMKRTGYFESSSPLLNRLFENIVWGQRGNFLDVPTDCPQRDERLGWTGDAQVFVRTASYIYDCERFFDKWLADLASEQYANGAVPHVIPRMHWDGEASCGWADAAVICPWQIYLTYGSKELLARQFSSMCAWVDYMRARTVGDLWEGGDHFGDWVHLDGNGNPTTKYFLQNAYFAYSASIVIKAGKVLGLDVSGYEDQLARTKTAFAKEFIQDGKVLCNTQSACAIALYFDLVPAAQKQSVAAQLENLIKTKGHMTTGFLGTPYLLHALSQSGRAQMAYDLLLREEYPSWLYSVKAGATTIWEHWDGMKPDGTMWDVSMNSFNHYAYGCVADWMFGVAAGIELDEENPAFAVVRFKPQTTARLDYVKASIDTRHGLVQSAWARKDGVTLYTFTVPDGVSATAEFGGRTVLLNAGEHSFSIQDDE